MVAMLAMVAALTLAADAAPAAPSRQAIYDAAQTAYDKSDWAAAAAGFARVVNPAGRDSPNDGLVRARLATALMMLDRPEEARPEAERAVHEIAAGTPSGKSAELADAYVLLGDVLRQDLAMAEAVAAYDKGRAALPAGASSFQLDVGTIQAAMVIAPDRAAAAADAALARKDIVDKMDAEQRALLLSLRGRAELNRGHFREAADYVARASDTAGHLTTKVSLIQAQVRSDAALAYTMVHDIEKARLYLAYSGGGYMPSMAWIGHKDGDLPVCGDEIHPEDVAVVELAIRADGTVARATPIYASRPGEMGVAFAQNLRDWHWLPEDVARLNAFWRAAVRLEVRCVTRPAPQEMGASIRTEANAWIDAHIGSSGRWGAANAGGKRADAPSDRYTPVRALLDQTFAFRATNVSPERVIAIDAALEAVDAPPSVRAFAARITVNRVNHLATKGAPKRAAVLAEVIQRIARQAGSAYPVAWLRTELALEYEAAGALDQARREADAVLATPSAILPDRDPIRLVATLHRALVDQQGGDAEAATARLEQAGLDAAQCSLFDVRPVAQNTAISSAIFPDEARRWGMGGNVLEGFDIAADGSVKQVRTVLAYPPFVFGDASQRAVGRFRYLPPTVGKTALSCAGKLQTINYVFSR